MDFIEESLLTDDGISNLLKDCCTPYYGVRCLKKRYFTFKDDN